MTTQNIIGYYKSWLLIERDGIYAIVKRKNATEKVTVLFSGSEEDATKIFTMLIANYIDENTLKEGL